MFFDDFDLTIAPEELEELDYAELLREIEM